MSKLLVLLGATGATGSHILRLALEDGLRVRAYVRAPAKIPDSIREHDDLEIAEGTFEDSDAVRAAIEGADFVVCAGGNAKASKARRVMSALVEDVIAGMRTHGVKRLLYQAGAFSPAPGTKNPGFVRVILRPVLGGLMGISGMLADNDAVMAYLDDQRDDIDWTVTRPGMLKEKPSKGSLKVSEKLSGASHFVDLARFTLDTVTSDALVHQFPYVGY